MRESGNWETRENGDLELARKGKGAVGRGGVGGNEDLVGRS